MRQELGYKHLSVNAMKRDNITMYQLRLLSKYGRKTIDVRV